MCEIPRKRVRFGPGFFFVSADRIDQKLLKTMERRLCEANNVCCKSLARSIRHTRCCELWRRPSSSNEKQRHQIYQKPKPHQSIAIPRHCVQAQPQVAMVFQGACDEVEFHIVVYSMGWMKCMWFCGRWGIEIEWYPMGITQSDTMFYRIYK